MNNLPQIGMLWMRGALSYLEQLCIQSFLDIGHHVVLYHYGEVERVPQGVEFRDANEFMPDEGKYIHKEVGSPALHSDLFRYRMLAKYPDMIWADTDAYCVKPFLPKSGYLFGFEGPPFVACGVLAFPKESPTLQALIEFTNEDYPMPNFVKPRQKRILSQARGEGNPIHISEQVWGTSGPKALTHFLQQTGEIAYALPTDYLYPIRARRYPAMARTVRRRFTFVTENTVSIHFYGHAMRPHLTKNMQGLPQPQSLMSQLLIKHKINPIEAPLSTYPNPDPDSPAARSILEGIKSNAQISL